jgi:hypothetical protein
MGAYFNWRTPSSLFPPSAVITITDDNSTNFVARPAAFGPLLPPQSLSGQLWIGSGFGNDHFGRGSSGAGAGGELGCSDVPGWDDGSWAKKTTSDGRSGTADGQTKSSHRKRSAVGSKDQEEESDDTEQPLAGDGTDDHLHHPLPPSDGLKTNGASMGSSKKPTHADIQSLQEGAEIMGKVVLLSRGGCGFLEKVKWVQRRGGIALVVGDDIRGGPLVTMYARGDTSNVTIPSLFTSYTTAQLLSSLMPAGGNSLEDLNRSGIKSGGQESSSAGTPDDTSADKPNFTTTKPPTAQATSSPRKGSHKESATPNRSKDTAKQPHHTSWFSFFFGSRSENADSRRPPSSGNNGWVQQKDFEDDAPAPPRLGNTGPTIAQNKRPSSTVTPESEDGFQIGIQDWRDPDLVAEQREQQQKVLSTSSTASDIPRPTAATTSLKGGSITPGSGEYNKANHEAVDVVNTEKSQFKSNSKQPGDQQASRGWLGRLFSSNDAYKTAKTGHDSSLEPPHVSKQDWHHAYVQGHDRSPQAASGAIHHEGLWVTLSQTSMSTSPFFDTLLVLVVSPLVTLTVVYALLLLRSRIRRRRWRAPKSVVERLPVRTYQTMPSTTNSSSSTSISSQANPTTPLLPASRPISTRSRPRSRTTPEVPQASSSLSDEMASPSLEQIEEKRAAGLAEWRRRYGGKQRECVVCLEEYIDGVSRVMSLPCGHEFHAECM